LELVMIYQIIK